MTKRVLSGALGMILLLAAQEQLRAQAISPAELPDAPLPRQSDVPGAQEMAQTNPGRNVQSDPKAPTDPLDAPNQPLNTNGRQQNGTRDRGFPPVRSPLPGRAPVPRAARPFIPGATSECVPASCSPAQGRICCNPALNSYARFLEFSWPGPLTPKDKFLLAWRGVRDPFNLLTIGGEAAISIASNSHTAYGPGFPGFGKYAGVSLTEDMTSEFFGAFLIPSLAHQDPRYRRMPNLPMRRRIIHVLDSGFVGQDDNGFPMFNYANVFGTIGSSALGNVYIPGRETSWGASTARISVALATNPIGNALAEFLPDVARRINVNVVLVQRVINRVAIAEGGVASQ